MLMLASLVPVAFRRRLHSTVIWAGPIEMAAGRVRTSSVDRPHARPRLTESTFDWPE